MSGFTPLTWPSFHAWREERGLPRLNDEEIDRLFILDAVMLSPDTEEKAN